MNRNEMTMADKQEKRWLDSPRSTMEADTAAEFQEAQQEDVIMTTGDYSIETPTEQAVSEPYTTNNQDIVSPNQPNILHLISDETLWAEIFSHVGAAGTAHCARVCRSWHRLVQAPAPLTGLLSLKKNRDGLEEESDVSLWMTRQALWRQFVLSSYAGVVESAGGATKNGKEKHNVDWRAVYSYIATQERTQHRQRLHARVVFADDGTHFPGYPPSHALRPDRTVWCTSPGVDRNVDLVVQFFSDLNPLRNIPALIGSVYASNGGRGYSAPLKDALVFASMDRPDLNMARAYDGDSGSQWVQYMEAVKRQEARQRYGGGCNKTTNSIAVNRQFTEVDDVPTAQQCLTVEINDRERRLDEEVDDDEHLKESCARTTAIKRPPTPLPPATDCASTPIAGFQFPPLPHAYEAAIEQNCSRPTVGRYIHFKLLSSYKRPDLMELSDNIDVQQLLCYGVPLPDLPRLLQLDDCSGDTCNSMTKQETMGSDDEVEPAPTIPTNYRRMHAIRPPRFLWDDRREEEDWMDDAHV